MGSSRLPGKVMAEIEGVPMIGCVLRRAAAAETVDAVVVATSTEPRDDVLEQFAESEGVPCIRGSESDVLGRYVVAASVSQADVIVRLTSDCPLLEPSVVDVVVRRLIARPCDYASNVLERTYPKGLDVEALWSDVLHRVARLAVSPASREHVTWFVRGERPELFLRESVKGEGDWSALDWSVDTADDLERIRRIYRERGSTESWESVAATEADRG